MMSRRAAAVLPVLLLFAGCSSMSYDLTEVPFSVSAKPGDGETFSLKSKYVLYGYGLFGEKQPGVAEELRAHCAGAARVTDFRVTAYTSIWDWLGTHLTLGLLRMKTVTISGRQSRR